MRLETDKAFQNGMRDTHCATAETQRGTEAWAWPLGPGASGNSELPSEPGDVYKGIRLHFTCQKTHKTRSIFQNCISLFLNDLNLAKNKSFVLIVSK